MNDIAFSRQTMSAAWQQHTHAEFVLKDADTALATMTANPYVLCIPSGMGGTGRAGVREFYARQFLPNIPPDFELNTVSQVFGGDHGRRVRGSLQTPRRTGCCQACRPPAGKSSSPWWPSSGSKLTRSPTSTSTGIRPRSSPSWALRIIPSRRQASPARHDF